MSWIYRTLVVPAPLAEQVKGLCAILAGAAGESMFTTALSSTGSLPATHYISAGMISEEFASLLPLNGQGGDVNHLVSLAASAGTNISYEVLEAILNASIVSDEDAHTFLLSNNLKICSSEVVL